jgi:type II secretory ATPase GspE/PulE/Tfp pilus assembly ATPase PilB-like protein
MGVKPYLLGSCLTLIMAQRLVRRICEHCKETYEPPEGALQSLGLAPGETYYRGKGCRRCDETGYYGRVAIFELLSMDKDLGRAISRDASEAELRGIAEQKGVTNLRESGIRKIRKGITTVEEVLARTME